MAYLIFTVKGRELGRRRLLGPTVIGRSTECDICVHDILLSRHHCAFEREGSHWVLVDLESKNGTHVGSQPVARRAMHDGELVRIGKTTITYRVGPFVPKSGAGIERGSSDIAMPRKRAADPFEAMTATVSGMDYIKSRTQGGEDRIGSRPRKTSEAPIGTVSRMPTPQPSPRVPDAYQSDDVYSLLNELASSSWDSIYMNASRPLPTRPAPTPMLNSRHPRQRGLTPMGFSKITGGMLAQTPAGTKPKSRWRRALLSTARGFATLGQAVMVLGIAHLLTQAR